MLYFHVYGLIIRSSVKLHGFPIIHPNLQQTLNVDAEIISGEVDAAGLNHPVEQGLFFQVQPEHLWLNVPVVGRFLVQSGTHIIYELNAEGSTDALLAFLTGPCLAALLMQRGLFVLTGSVVRVNERAVACIGEPCTGKSSLIAAMMKRGHALMADGLCVINKSGMVFPGAQHIEMWDDSLNHINTPDLQPVRAESRKYRLHCASFFNQPLPLHELYVLHSRKGGVLYTQELRGAEKLNFLQKNIYNKIYLAGFKKNQLYFSYCVQLAQQIKMTLIEFNSFAFAIQELTNTVVRLQEEYHE